MVVVTGAGGGIGSRIVDRFLANGDRVIGLDRAESLITLSFPYLSWTCGVLRRLKISRSQGRGGRLPPGTNKTKAQAELVVEIEDAKIGSWLFFGGCCYMRVRVRAKP